MTDGKSHNKTLLENWLQSIPFDTKQDENPGSPTPDNPSNQKITQNVYNIIHTGNLNQLITEGSFIVPAKTEQEGILFQNLSQKHRRTVVFHPKGKWKIDSKDCSCTGLLSELDNLDKYTSKNHPKGCLLIKHLSHDSNPGLARLKPY